MKTEKIIQAGKGIELDVRTRAEFRGGHVAGSKNIPLTELPDEIENLKSWEAPIILCCASGMRSAQAEQYLSRAGINCVNGGSWLEVNYLQSKAS
ncbi:rhodanese-like domain-containing protein [Salinimicrobium tongyeongense]|uniref:Rhodanese-like domain-containing protein n=1 Tax=Salinimicrobium tongyeongense TaxID=2809707 RepID=A0ABY6NTB7_9FLAO|nr:rhodanese-like domain-containing protein [Salinimicrobium tongyeongense]UZH55723.1 rhodanese-like domain-containing protein [Salinimicrobium tongyeongense]